MKHILCSTLIVFAVTTTFAGDKQVSGKTYTFTVPEQVESRPPGNSDVYSFQWKSGLGTTIFVVSATHRPSSLDRLHARADEMQKELEKGFTQDGQFKIRQKQNKEIELGGFKGVEIEFALEYSPEITIRHYHFFLSDGAHTLVGQLIAHAEKDRDQAYAMITNAQMRTNGKNE